MVLRLFCVLSLLLTCVNSVRSQEFPRETIQKGKDATAFLIVGKTSSTAFCFHADGYFATSFQADRAVGVGKKVRLILYPGEKREKDLEGTLLFSAASDDVAILKVDEKFDFPVLELGSTSNLAESEAMLALGYPFGNALSLYKGHYPTISVTAGEVTTLKKENELVNQIGTDIRAVPGCTGGPLINKAGKVVGIQQVGLDLGRNIVAVPVEKMTRLVQEPRLEFAPKPISSYEDRSEEREYFARLHWVLPPLKPYELNLHIEAENQEAQVIPMLQKNELNHELYSAKASLKPIGENIPDRLPVTMLFGADKLSGHAVDCQFKIDQQALRLRELSSLKQGSSANTLECQIRGGQKISGTPSGLESISVQLGSQTLEIDPHKISLATFPKLTFEFKITVKVIQDGRTILSSAYKLDDSGHSTQIPSDATEEVKNSAVKKPVLSSPAANPQVSRTKMIPGHGRRPNIYGITSVELATKLRESGRVSRVGNRITKHSTILMPCKIEQVTIAGEGRYLIVHLAAQKKLAIIDLLNSKICNYIPLPEDNILIAGGATKLMVALNDSRVIQRWNLETAQREASAPIDAEGELVSMALGVGSEGPLLLSTLTQRRKPSQYPRSEFSLVDLKTLKSTKHQLLNAHFGSYSKGVFVSASEDGRSFGVIVNDNPPSSSAMVSIDGEQVTLAKQLGMNGFVLPTASAHQIGTAFGLFNSQFESLDSTDSKREFAMPSHSAGFYLRGKVVFSPLGETRAMYPKVHIVHQNDRDLPLATLTEAALIEPSTRNFTLVPRKIQFQDRLLLSPDTEKLAVIPIADDRVVLHDFSLEQALQALQKDYLLVMAGAPPVAKANTLLRYDLKVRSSKGGVTCRLLSSPEGMEISSQGIITWQVPENLEQSSTIVSLKIKDEADQERLHGFTLRYLK